LETQKSAEEVGGWHNTHLMRVSVAVIFDSLENRFLTFDEYDIDDLLNHLEKADLVVGFNVKKFDYSVLSAYTNKNLRELPTFDILEDVSSFAGGAAFTVLNFNRNSSKTSGMTVTTGHTGSDLITPTGGSEIWNETLGTRGAQSSRENASELILKQNSKYLFRITNGATANNVSILLTWYEHTNKEA